ncbi:MAG: hypothetical protein LBT37_02445 [Lactobacillaceae bacterium]|jgi:hypothetical protein|nr:hypothetical protein [Lactobacillaceae bacterium]
MTSDKKFLSLILISTIALTAFGGRITSNVYADNNPVASDSVTGFTGVGPMSDTDPNSPLGYFVNGRLVKPVSNTEKDEFNQGWVYENGEFVDPNTLIADGPGSNMIRIDPTTPTKTPATPNQQNNPSTTASQSAAPTTATLASGSTTVTKQATDGKTLLPATDATSNFGITALVLSATAGIFGLFGSLLKRNK